MSWWVCFAFIIGYLANYWHGCSSKTLPVRKASLCYNIRAICFSTSIYSYSIYTILNILFVPCTKRNFSRFIFGTNHNMAFSHTELKKAKLITFYTKLNFFRFVHGTHYNMAFSYLTELKKCKLITTLINSCSFNFNEWQTAHTLSSLPRQPMKKLGWPNFIQKSTAKFGEIQKFHFWNFLKQRFLINHGRITEVYNTFEIKSEIKVKSRIYSFLEIKGLRPFFSWACAVGSLFEICRKTTLNSTQYAKRLRGTR